MVENGSHFESLYSSALGTVEYGSAQIGMRYETAVGGAHGISFPLTQLCHFF